MTSQPVAEENLGLLLSSAPQRPMHRRASGHRGFKKRRGFIVKSTGTGTGGKAQIHLSGQSVPELHLKEEVENYAYCIVLHCFNIVRARYAGARGSQLVVRPTFE